MLRKNKYEIPVTWVCLLGLNQPCRQAKFIHNPLNPNLFQKPSSGIVLYCFKFGNLSMQETSSRNPVEVGMMLCLLKLVLRNATCTRHILGMPNIGMDECRVFCC